MSTPSVVALIPARAGSKRVKGKNVRPLGGHPVLAYSIAAAVESGVFAAVIVSTDAEEYAAIARHYGAEVPFLRPPEIAGDKSPDVEWVAHALARLRADGRAFDCFSILRPTSPFRKPQTIRRAWAQFLTDPGADSLRAVEKCGQHPGKMWVLTGGRMHPLLLQPANPPWHSSQYAALPPVYVQNASLEIAWSRVAFADPPSIAGDVLMPFLTEGDEGYDVNTEDDWILAEHLLAAGRATLPTVSRPPYPGLP
jgi:CMP-N-acetylneuraminic acid synthetase